MHPIQPAGGPEAPQSHQHSHHDDERDQRDDPSADSTHQPVTFGDPGDDGGVHRLDVADERAPVVALHLDPGSRCQRRTTRLVVEEPVDRAGQVGRIGDPEQLPQVTTGEHRTKRRKGARDHRRTSSHSFDQHDSELSPLVCGAT